MIKGIVIKEYIIGEGDKYITLFTHELGQVQVFVAKSKDYRLGAGTQLFVYSLFEIKKTRDKYRLISAEPINSFYKLREDIVSLSYASYIIEFLSSITQEGQPNKDLFRLTLYTLHELTKANPPVKLIRCIYELRAMRCIGFMPNVEECVHCGKELGEISMDGIYNFSVSEGGYVCCKRSDYRLRYDTLYTIRYILYSDYRQLFSFTLDRITFNELSTLVNNYISYYVEKSFRTLTFISQLII